MNEFIKWITDNKDFVQIICSVLMLIVTIIYIVVTNKLVHIPHKTFLKVKSFNYQIKNESIKYNFEIFNYGNDIAMDVNIMTIETITIRKDSNIKFSFKYDKFTNLVGDYEIRSGESKIFEIDSLLKYTHPIFLTWKSLTGKKYKALYLLDLHNNIRFVRVTHFQYIKFMCTRVWLSILKPYYLFLCWKNSDYSYVKIKILQRLNNEGSLTADYIADKSIKSDYEIEVFLVKMRKEGLVSLGSFYEATITEKGKQYLKKKIS